MKMNREVHEYIRPIVDGMTNIYETNKHVRPQIGGNYENESTKMIKRDCVHLITDNTSGKAMLAVRKTNEGKLVCQACGKEISTDFGKDAEKIVDDFEKVVNQLVMFGMLQGLRLDPIKTLISVKHVLPDISALALSLGQFMTSGTNSVESLGDIGSEFVDTTGNSITSLR